MSETCRSKRESRRRMPDALPAGLRPHVAQYNLEAVPPSSRRRRSDCLRLCNLDSNACRAPLSNCAPIRTPRLPTCSNRRLNPLLCRWVVDHQFDPGLDHFQFPSEKSGHFYEQVYVIGGKVAANRFLSLRSKRAGTQLVQRKLGCSGFQTHRTPHGHLISLECSPEDTIFPVLRSRWALPFQFPVFRAVSIRPFEHFSPCS